MKLRNYLTALFPALMLTAIVAVQIATFAAEDSCFDRGGAVLRGLCYTAPDTPAALDYSFTPVGWVLFAILAAIPGLMVFGLIYRAVTGIRGGSSA